MSTDKQNNGQSQAAGAIANVVSLMDILKRTLRHWPWLLLSLIICCGLGVLYILHTPEKFSQSAVLIIKDDNEGGSVSRDLASIGLFQNSSNLENEVATFKSPDLMEMVVEELNLEYNYFKPGFLRKDVVYGKKQPVTVNIAGLSPKATAMFNLTVATNGDVSIEKCKYFLGKDKKKSKDVYHGKLNKPIKTLLGEITVIPTQYYNKKKEVELKVVKQSLFDAVEGYCKNLSVDPDEDGGTVITLTLDDTSVERADNVLAALVRVYRETWIEEKNQVAVATSNFINERLKVIEQELGNVDSDISEYKTATLIPNIHRAADAYAAQNDALTNTIYGLTSELQVTRYLRDYVTAPAHQDALLPVNVGLTGNISSAIENYNMKMIERNNLAAKSSDKNPLVVSLDSDLDAMRQAILAHIDNSIVSLKTQISDLQGQRSETRTKLATTPSQAKYLLSVERQQKVKENLYLFLLQKREDNEIEQAFTAQNFRLIQRPGGSEKPVSPPKKLILAASFLLGILIPYGWQYYKVSTDTKVHGRSDCKGLSMPLLGEIPLYKGKENQNTTILVKPAMRDAVNESFRVLRTNIDFVKPEKSGEAFVLAITSINPGSGKSFIAANIATAIAIRNNRVLLIDADLRRGSSSEYAGAPSKGLSDYLAGRVADVHSVIVKPLGNEGPDVLPIGSIPPNPTELIENPAFGEMIEKLRKEYDYIFCDCPPIDIVADTRIIDKYVDRTIFIIRAGLLDKSQLPEIDTLYANKQYKNMVYVINGTHYEGKGYGNTSYGTYGYGYGNAPSKLQE